MTRISLTFTDVTAAYDALVDAGKEPTISAISAHLGDKDHLKTIADHVRTLKVERWPGQGPALPDPLLQSLVSGAETYWSELAEAADARVTAYGEQCDTQLQAVRAELESTVAQRDVQLNEMRAELESTIAQRDVQLNDVRTELEATITQRDAQLEEMRTELESTITQRDAQLEEMRAELESTITQRDAQLEEMRAELASAMTQRDTQLGAIRAELNKAQNNEAPIRDELLVKNKKISTLESQLAETANQLQTTVQNLETTKAELIKAGNNIEHLETVKVDITHERNEAQRLLDEARQSVESLKNQMQTREQQYDAVLMARDKVDKIRSADHDATRASLSTATQSLDHWESRQEQWRQDNKALTKQLNDLQGDVMSHQNQKAELQRKLAALKSENVSIKAQLQATRKKAIEAEKQHQSLIEAISAEFTSAVGETHIL